jgi:UDP-glucose 4-epimerase
MKNILITGGTGFVGSNLVSFLKKKNFNINILDKKISRKFKHYKNVKLIKGDILDYNILEKLSIGCDTIYHFAALTNLQESLKKQKKYILNNYLGTVNVVKVSIKFNLNLIFASSAAVYPLNINKRKINERISFFPTNIYGLTKKLCEEYILNCKNELKKFTIFRFFNIYGKNQTGKINNYSSVIPKFINLAKMNQTLELYNKGQQSRDFIYIDDIINLCFKAGLKPANCILNLGSGKSIKILKIADYIKNIIKKGIIVNGTEKENYAKFS